MTMSSDPTYPLYPILSFLGFIISFLPLPWHLQAWNSGTCAFMIWTGLTCLNYFVNSLIWSGNVVNRAPIWCDISTKFVIGVSAGIPASILCITRRLYHLTVVQRPSITRQDKRRMVIDDICIALGIPVLVMILHVVIQAHRFDILEDIGCYPVVYNTLPAYFLYFHWPVLLGCISFIYSSLTLRSFWIRRLQFSRLMAPNSPMNASRYLRLMLLSVVDMMFTIPLGVYTIYIGTKGLELAPWISWADTHFNFSRVVLVPAIFWRSDPNFRNGVELTRWLPVLCAFVFFGLFGFASEAMKHYKRAFWCVARLFGKRPAPNKGLETSYGWSKTPKQSNPSVGSLPVYVPKTPTTPSASQKKLRPNSISSSFANVDVESDTYFEIDIEKTGGLSPTTTACTSPPAYSRPQPSHVPVDVSPFEADGETEHNIPSSSSSSLPNTMEVEPQPEPKPKPKASKSSLHTMNSDDRVYICDGPRDRTPSPAPFTDMIPPYHRPFTPPNGYYPLTLPHPGSRSLTDVLQVMIHKESHSTDAL